MRILHLADRLTTRGGAYRHLLGLLEHQAERHQVCLAVGAVEPGVAVPCGLETLSGLEARTAAEAAIEPLAEAFRPDVIHVHTILNPRLLEWAGRRGAVMTVQDHRWFCPGRGKWTLSGEPCRAPLSRAACAACFDDQAYFEATWELTQARLAALRRLRLVALSHYMRAELRAAGCEGPIDVVPPFVHDLARVPCRPGPACVLYAGRLARAKGVWEALAAWRRSGLELPLHFAGSGPERHALERAGAHVLGWLDRPALASALAGARALLFPSRWQEPFGIAGLEALHCGVPVAAWDSGGVREWHSGDGLVPWGDVEALAAALRRVVGRLRAGPPDGTPRARLRSGAGGAAVACAG